MSVNKRRVFNKWILPKNNNDTKRHKIYVAFVVNFYTKYNRWPTDIEYKKEIVKFLVAAKQNKKHKKTAENHQLFQPIFYELLEFDGKVVKPTKNGIALMLDVGGVYFTELMFESLWDSTFSSGATGSLPKFNSVHPIRTMLRHLVNKGKISFEQLAYCFYSTFDQSGKEALTPIKSNVAQWEYIVKILVDAKLIELNGQISTLRPGTPEKPNLNFKPNGYIKPTLKLISLIKDKEKGNSNIKDILSMFDIPYNEINIAKIIKESKSKAIQLNNQRDSAAQTAWKTMLMLENPICFICGIDEPLVLIASHIKPYSKCNLSEQFDINNGLILCSNHDQLFDKGYLTFIKNKIVFSQKIDIFDWDLSIEKSILNFEFNFLSEQNVYMNYHNEKVFKD